MATGTERPDISSRIQIVGGMHVIVGDLQDALRSMEELSSRLPKVQPKVQQILDAREDLKTPQ